MAIDKKLSYLEDDSLYAKRKNDEQNWSEFGELATEQYKNWAKYQDGQSGIVAKSSDDYVTRSCVKCNGPLKVYEETDNGYVMLQCRKCGFHQWHTDIAPYSKEEKKILEEAAKISKTTINNIPDKLYRDIPDSLILEYTEMRKQSQRE